MHIRETIPRRGYGPEITTRYSIARRAFPDLSGAYGIDVIQVIERENKLDISIIAP